MHCEFDEEFRMRVKHNFKLYVLLTSKTKNWKEDDILNSICQLTGYKSHKAVKYEMNSSHIHIKFDDEWSASKAVDYLNSLSTDLTAVLVDDMLRDWFSYEMKSGHTPPWTLTIVDITGSPPFNLNFLTENILNSIFCNFGDPYLLPYTAALNEPHVQVLFGSMTEALAACMAFGEWYYRDEKIDSFFYRVRINPSDKEAILIRNSGGIAREAFKLDYFVNVRNEIIKNKNCSDKQRTPGYKNVPNKAIEKTRKHKCILDSQHKHNDTHQVTPRTPILCVPVIAPLNSSYAEALTSTKKFNVDFSKTVLNIRRTCSVSTGALDNGCEIDFHQSIQGERVDKVSRWHDINNLEQLGSISKQVPLIHSISAPEKEDLVSQKLMDNVATRQGRNINKGPYRGAERRKPKVILNLGKSSELQTAASVQQDCGKLDCCMLTSSEQDFRNLDRSVFRCQGVGEL